MHFDSAAVVIIEDRRSPVLYAALRSLAETRRALAAFDCADRAVDCETTLCYCRACDSRTAHAHEPTCVLAAMPRPPQTR